MVWPSRRLPSKPVALMAAAFCIASAQDDRSAASICTDARFTVHIHEHGNGDWVELSTSPPSDLHATIRSPGAAKAFHGTYCLPPNREYVARFRYIGKSKQMRNAVVEGRFSVESQGDTLVPPTFISQARNAPFSVACRKCAPGSFALDECSVEGGTDTTCAPCSPSCPSDHFELTACDAAHSDRVCQRCSNAPPDAYEVRSCSSQADAVFVECPPCPPGMHTYIPCSEHTDRKICIENSEEQFVLSFIRISAVFFMTAIALWMLLLLMRCVLGCIFGFDTIGNLGADWSVVGGSQGATESQINDLPLKTFRSPRANGRDGDGATIALNDADDTTMGFGQSQMLCSICLDDFEDGEQVRELRCNHIFHVQCIDEWLRTKDACPLCNRAIAGPDHSLQFVENESMTLSMSTEVSAHADDVAALANEGASTSESAEHSFELGVMNPRGSRRVGGGTAADMIEGDEAQPFTRDADDDTAEDGLGNGGEASASAQHQYQYGTR